MNLKNSEQKKPDTNVYILCDSIHMKSEDWQKEALVVETRSLGTWSGGED